MRRLLPLLVLAMPALADTPPIAETPLATLPYTPGLNPAFMDRSADPCTDFYAYSCGGWQKLNPIPADQTRWGVYGKLSNEILRHLWGLLTEAANPASARNPIQAQIGDAFAACMNEAGVEALGARPLEPALKALAAVKDRKGLATWLAERHLTTGDSQLLFGFSSEQDASDATQFIAAVYAGGLGLPDRDDYLDTDAKSTEQRARYLEHVAKMLQLLGDSPPKAQATAKLVLDIETELARASLTRVERRDPYKVFHRMEASKLKQLAPAFDWATYFAASAVPRTRMLNVSQPKFFEQLNTLLQRRPLSEWKQYLRWHLVNSEAEYLSPPFVQEDFAFNGKYMRGAEQLPPRWKRCVRYVDRDLGEALGQVFVQKNFSPELKQRALTMVVAIEKEMEQDIRTLDWMSPATKEQALSKLHAMANKIGYPDQWRDYSSIHIARDDFFGNVARSVHFESARQLGKIGKPIDRGEWQMTPPTVNAYYNPNMNDMNFSAGILQPPLYDAKMDDAPNYGNTGGTIGHELTHGFDDEGRQFDAHGNLKDWWTKEDAAEFTRRASCISNQYSSYIAVGDVHVNGKLTLGEDVADLGGLILAYRAWKKAIANIDQITPIDGLTPEQRFFVGNAQWACENVRPETARLRARIDPHSPPKYRVNGLVVIMPEFARAFGCKQGEAMVKPPEAVCRVW
jgi:putative endopeptidase